MLQDSFENINPARNPSITWSYVIRKYKEIISRLRKIVAVFKQLGSYPSVEKGNNSLQTRKRKHQDIIQSDTIKKRKSETNSQSTVE